MDNNQPTPEYFALCQLESNQYISQCKANATAITPLSPNHPYQAEIKKLPKAEQSKQLYWSVEFTQTPFFPVGGGQQYDCGHILIQNTTLQYPIIAVHRVNNLISHVVATPKDIQLDQILIPTETIHLIVDMSRRLYLMHQHTSQHLISAIMQQCFKFDTFGWSSGTFPSSPISTLPFTRSSWEIIQNSISCIDFQCDFQPKEQPQSILFLNTTIKFLITALYKNSLNTHLDANNNTVSENLQLITYPVALFYNKLTQLLAIFPYTTDSLNIQQLIINFINTDATYTDLYTYGWNTILPINSDAITFEHISYAAELISNFIISITSKPTQVEIEGVIAAPIVEINDILDSTPASTTSLGATTTTITESGDVIRQNERKVAKYAANGPVPKRFINILVEKSPCCGTHVGSLNELQSINIYNAFKHGGRWRITFAPMINQPAITHWCYSSLDILKSKFCCQFKEIHAFVDKSIATNQSLKIYTSKIISSVSQIIFTKYNDEINLMNQNDTKSLLLHYNDAFFTTPTEFAELCSAVTQLCMNSSISRHPLLLLTNTDPSDFSQAGIFFLYGNEKDTNATLIVKTLGPIFAETMGTKGGGRPGLFQGKLAKCTELRNAIDKIKSNNINVHVVSNVPL